MVALEQEERIILEQSLVSVQNLWDISVDAYYVVLSMVKKLNNLIFVAKFCKLLLPLSDKIDYLEGDFSVHADVVDQLH